MSRPGGEAAGAFVAGVAVGALVGADAVADAPGAGADGGDGGVEVADTATVGDETLASGGDWGGAVGGCRPAGGPTGDGEALAVTGGEAR